MLLILIIILSFILFTNIIFFIGTYLFIVLKVKKLIKEHHDFINHSEDER